MRLMIMGVISETKSYQPTLKVITIAGRKFISADTKV